MTTETTRRFHYRIVAPVPRTEAEARAATAVCEQVGRLLRGRQPGRIDAHELAALVDAYEAWRAIHGEAEQ